MRWEIFLAYLREHLFILVVTYLHRIILVQFTVHYCDYGNIRIIINV